MKQLIYVSFTIALFLFCSARATANDWLIIPGQSIGQISVGMEHAEVLRLLGAPHRQDDLDFLEGDRHPEFKGVLRDDWITIIPVSRQPEQDRGVFMVDFVTVYVKDRRVVQIEIRSPHFKTKDDLTSASTGITWRRHFPNFTKSFQKFAHPVSGGWPASKHFITFEDAIGTGVAWRYAAMGNLSPDPEPEEKVETVAVHEPGKPMIIDPDGGSRFIWKDGPRELSTEH